MLVHIILAVLIQAVTARLCRSWVAGAAVAGAWSLSREITQAEYRWIERYGDGLRANMRGGAGSTRACGRRPIRGWTGSCRRSQ